MAFPGKLNDLCGYANGIYWSLVAGIEMALVDHGLKPIALPTQYPQDPDYCIDSLHSAFT